MPNIFINIEIYYNFINFTSNIWNYLQKKNQLKFYNNEYNLDFNKISKDVRKN